MNVIHLKIEEYGYYEQVDNEYRELFICNRTDGPAFTSWDDEGNIVEQSWIVNGKLHRLSGPADVYSHNGVNIALFFLFGKLSRIDGPAVIMTGPAAELNKAAKRVNANIKCEVNKEAEDRHLYFINDENISESVFLKPGFVDSEIVKDGIYFDGPKPSKKYTAEAWCYIEDGICRLHRDDGPAVIRSYNGIVVEELWMKHSFDHSVTGPAVRQYSENGVLTKEIYCLYGSNFDKEIWTKLVSNPVAE
jgi:hypothetical protein